MVRYQFGKTDLVVSKLAFGGNVLGWTLDEKNSLHMLDELFDQGVNFIDTSNNYSHWVEGHLGGESESLIGKWFKESKKRHDIVLSTKVGGRMGDGTRGLSRQNILASVDDSLRRLRTDYIDLYFSHHDDSEVPLEETMEAFHTLVKMGKVRYLGASNLDASRIESSNQIAINNSWTPYVAIQPLYNLCDRVKYEEEYLPLVKKENLAVMSYFALASGFLSGKYRTVEDIKDSARKDMVKGYLNERCFKILDQCEAIAHSHSASIAEVAIAWQCHKESINSPIVSATSTLQLKSLIRSTSLELSSEDLLLLDLVSAQY